ncbi:uncharacterized protein LOC127038030 isoform X1 [Gopherus flavomarginatus]|uniref:uncharacterized protein LOC127038030 isoform X1 n=1 Tax=Gopherus flavomarginatus TaxID=286002 RepID=UPI0021CC0FDD|nr:uncharacterized protein LOC127038030 isoform X1 [Gopherus flavomarginatus]
MTPWGGREVGRQVHAWQPLPPGLNTPSRRRGSRSRSGDLVGGLVQWLPPLPSSHRPALLPPSRRSMRNPPPNPTPRRLRLDTRSRWVAGDGASPRETELDQPRQSMDGSNPASLLSSCLQLAQAWDGVTIRQEPAALDVGGDMTLVVLGIPQTLLVCSWYRGAEAGIAANWILSYAPSATPQKFYGPAHTGREMVGPDCSLHITGLRGTDVGSYTLTVQGPGYNQAISMSISFSVRPLPRFLALIVGVPLAVLVCVALLVTFILCKRRHDSGASNLIEPPGERTRIVPQ